jgi:excisionase family DNA binding protein
MVEGKMTKSAIVVMTADELRGLVSEAVELALTKCGPRDASDIMDADQCAALIQVHEKTLAKLIEGDGLPTLRPVGKHRRFSRRAVLAWMDERSKDA